MPRVSLCGVFGGVLLEAAEEVAERPIGDVHRGQLNAVVTLARASDGDELGWLAGGVEGRQFQFEARPAFKGEQHALPAGAHSDLARCLRSEGPGRLLRFLRLAVEAGRVLLTDRRRRPRAAPAFPVGGVRLGRRRPLNQNVKPVARGHESAVSPGSPGGAPGALRRAASS